MNTMSCLLDWGNADEVGSRWQVSDFICPQCRMYALEDTWPPNYSHGMYGMDISEVSGNVKHVCIFCSIAFEINYHRKTERGKTLETNAAFNVTPLVERNGFLLTPHDVWRYEEHDKTGKWPHEAYC
jgi:hypothetical protein